MQTLGWNPRFSEILNRSWRRSVSVRAFSSPSSDFSNQSRSGLPRFYSEVLPPSKGDLLRVVGDEFWHMTKVLRLKMNDRIELFNGKGSLIEGCIQKVDHTGLDFVALENPKVLSPRTTEWYVEGWSCRLACRECAMYDVFELGAKSVTPLLTEHSPSISENRVDRLQRLILAATKQCQQLHEMTLNPPTKICGLLPIVAQSKLSLVAVAEANPIISALTSSKMESAGLLIIGPEGDFTEEEFNLIVEAGATAVGLGPHRLRVETATMTLLAALMLWSDSRHIPNP